MQEIIQIGVMKLVKTINNIEIPSIPNLNLMKSLNNAQGEAIEKIMRLHKESKQRSAFDRYIEEND